MPSTRRVKVLAICLAIGVCTVLYLSKDSSSQEFYSRTVAALERNDASDQEAALKLQAMKNAANAQDPVRQVETPQRPIAGSADKKAPFPDPDPSALAASEKEVAEKVVDSVDVEKSVAGRKTMKGGETKDLRSGKEAPLYPKGDVTNETTAEDKAESEEEHKVESELNTILKKGPIIIFSKSYCPYSLKAKNILLEKYTIVPAPYVVELDNHPLGPALQAALEKSTGRRTVPNVLVNGRSIGGGDDIQALDEADALIEKVKTMGGKRIMEAKLNK
ncbi:glutaredoxin 3, partial [Lecanoromycetidae sp. Uapishka_2]